MLNTQSVKHDYKQFFMMPDDLLGISLRQCRRAKWGRRHAYPFATSLRVLETWNDDLLKKLAQDGVTDDDLTEEMLWMKVEWASFCGRALHFFESRTCQKTLPRLIEAGYARQRYIKRGADNQRVCDENDLPLVYDTYQHAQDDKEHPGEIIHQVLFLSEAVNKDIAALSAPPPPTQPPTPPDPKTKKGDGAQGGNLVTTSPSKKDEAARGGNPDTASHSRDNISHPAQFCEGSSSLASQNSHLGRNTAQKDEGGESGQNTPSTPRKNAQDPSHMCEEASQKCEPPVGKNASNKNLNKEIREESNEESLISAAGAAGPLFDFDFSQHYGPTAILQLATRLMPLKEEYKTESRRQTALLSTEQTAEKLAQNDLLRERGLRHLARLLSYLADPNSPCKWRSYIRQQNPGFQPRLWHLNDKVVQLASREMEACDWWPESLTPQIPQTDPGREAVELSPVDIDMAELAEINPDRVCGMDRETARNLASYIDRLLGDLRLYVDYGLVDQAHRCRDRGYYVDFRVETSPLIRLYSLTDWETVEAQAEWLDSPEFFSRLAEAVRDVFIA